MSAYAFGAIAGGLLLFVRMVVFYVQPYETTVRGTVTGEREAPGYER